MDIELLIKLSPIVVATVHGYVAAWLAVKMLFRPRYPVYIFGRRLPLTPGMLPKEREHFIEALATVIAERLLDVETISKEILQLDLEPEITSIAHREYMHHSQSESTIEVVAEHLRERLYHLRDSAEARWEIVRSLRSIIETEIGRRFSLLRRVVTEYFLDDEALDRIVGESIDRLADRIVENIYVRTTIAQAMAQVPEMIMAQGAGSRTQSINSFISILSARLDIKSMLIKRLSALSNEAIEQLIMDTAGREIRAIVWFGAGIGLVVGIVQTLINFI
ncbi:MAG: DUF445 family protein [Acidobacteriota bacterium]|nr:MAG: DUF445 family protein [Acidobacteriota bacterium]